MINKNVSLMVYSYFALESVYFIYCCKITNTTNTRNITNTTSITNFSRCT